MPSRGSPSAACPPPSSATPAPSAAAFLALAAFFLSCFFSLALAARALAASSSANNSWRVQARKQSVVLQLDTRGAVYSLLLPVICLPEVSALNL